MRLQQIDILGFKSFRDRATIQLSEGMTVIVGPNGCGKSNVVDAIKWAMGDMSAKSLRGQSMEDVIFAGSETERPMGLADVTLTFENTGLDDDVKWGESIPREFRSVSEIAVTRRLHRSGESEYLINKVPCRLLDIQNLLAGTGLGKQGYSIIEQNRVGFIVSAKPTERRLLIEEASGITRYKGQRDRSMRRLNKAEENLLRVNDILSEVAKQLRGLERQAQRAAQHRRFVEEFRSLEIGILLGRVDALVEQIGGLDQENTAAKSALVAARDGLSRIEGQLERGRVDALAADKKNAATTEALYRAEAQVSLGRTRHEHTAAMLKDLSQRLSEKVRDEGAQRIRREELEVELATLVGALAAFDGADEEPEIEAQEAELRALRIAADQASAVLKAHQGEYDRLRTDFHRAEDRKIWLTDQLEELEEREKQAATQMAELDREARRWEAAVMQARRTLEAAQHQQEEGEHRWNEVVAQQAAAHDEVERRRSEFEELRQRDIRLEAEIETLVKMRERGEGFSDSVKVVMAWAARNERADVIGPIADIATGTPDDRRTLALILGASLSDIVVTSEAAARDAIAATAPQSRVVFWVGKPPYDLEHLIGPVCSDGVLAVVGHRVFAGEETGVAASVLDRNLRIESLSEEREKVLELATCAAESLAVAQLAAASIDGLEQDAKAAIDRAHVEVQSSQRAIEADSREVDRVRGALNRLHEQLVPLFRRQGERKDELERLLSHQGEQEKKIVRLRDGLVSKEAAAMAAVGAFERRREALMERRVLLAKRIERRRSLNESRSRIERGIASATALVKRNAEEHKALKSRIENTQAEAKSALEAIDVACRNLEICQEAMKKTGAEARAVRQRVHALEHQVRDARQNMEAALRKVQENNARRRDLLGDLGHAQSQFWENFEIEDLAIAHEVAQGISIPRNEWDSRRNYVRRRLDTMGPVNAMAEQEYQEAFERETFLREQNDDLERSISDLKRAIAEMDRESRRRFKETFEAVNTKFQDVFPRLFRGGQARLVLTQPDDLLTTGVDIEVRPPGKKQQNVMLLSGGEKALTAVSLIFSIFMLKPTPFAVLDEVDAPLDEANVGRFAQIVHEMSETSQMVVITHSRRTMESADVLYGVTMQQPGVSKLVSVKLSDVDDRKAS